MRAIRRFTVRAALPDPLAPLRDLMLNLRWSWHADTRDLFAAIDPVGWEASGHDPVALLGEVPSAQLESLATIRRSLRRLDDAARELDEYLSGPRWYQRNAVAAVLAPPRARPGRRPRSPTSPRSTESPRRCPSTPAASASWPVIISRPAATSACRSSAWACCTGTGTSPSRCRPRAGRWSGTRPATRTGCRSPCSVTPTGPPCGSASPWTRAAAGRADLGGAGRPGAAAAARLLRGGKRARAARGHRPALRRRRRSPAAPGTAARHRRRPGGPGVLRAHPPC